MAVVDVLIHQIPGHSRSRQVCSAMLEGIQRTGDKARIVSAAQYRGPNADVGLFYGMWGALAQALKDYPGAGKKAVYVDLGYWRRKDWGEGRMAGHHKLIVNGRHPDGYFQKRKHTGSRLKMLGVEMQPMRRTAGGPIVICGMGPKGAGAEGYQVNQWETDAVRTLRKHTDRAIIYRPKPNWREATPIDGCAMIRDHVDLADLLTAVDAHAVVSHHSNANIEALMAGCPGFTVEGPALALSLNAATDLRCIETPRYPEFAERVQWAADLAFTQYNIQEMREGLAWRYLRDEGLV